MAPLGENVKLVPQNVVYGETLEDYTLQVDYNLPANKREAQTPPLGDPYPGDEAPWGYIVVGTQWGTSMRRPDQGAQTITVLYAKVKTPYTSGIEGLNETYRKFETGRLGRRMGTRIFLAADEDAETVVEEALPEGTTMAEEGDWASALLRELTIERGWRVGLAKITAVYDTESDWTGFEAIGKGILEADFSTVRMWNRHTVSGQVIDEPFYDAVTKTRRRWAIIKGSNAWPYVKGQLRIKVLLTTSGLAALAPLVGKVNNGTCANILSAPAYTLWFNELTVRQRKRAEGRRYDTTVYLNFDPAGWDVATEAQLQQSYVREEQVYKEGGGAAPDLWQRHVVWEPVDGVETETLLGWADGNFGVINGYLA